MGVSRWKEYRNGIKNVRATHVLRVRERTFRRSRGVEILNVDQKKRAMDPRTSKMWRMRVTGNS